MPEASGLTLRALSLVANESAVASDFSKGSAAGIEQAPSKLAETARALVKARALRYVLDADARANESTFERKRVMLISPGENRSDAAVALEQWSRFFASVELARAVHYSCLAISE
jgi:hypothetical protein